MGVKIVETSLRDGHQSLFATRMTTDEVLLALKELDQVGYHAIEIWGGATFDACLRFLDEDPWERLRKVRKVCKKGAIIFIRNIDDGLNMAYPDKEYRFERSFDMIAKCDTTGYRRSGRELYTLLTRSGYKNISIEKMGLNSANMDYSEKEAFFDTIFKFLKNGINTTAKNNPNNKEILAERDWLEENLDELEEAFLSSETFVNFGFLIVVAKC
jgi:hypothetical protein